MTRPTGAGQSAGASGEHRPVEAYDFMPPGWCGGCDACGPAPIICVACTYGPDGCPLEPVPWPCKHADPQPQLDSGETP